MPVERIFQATVAADAFPLTAPTGSESERRWTKMENNATLSLCPVCHYGVLSHRKHYCSQARFFRSCTDCTGLLINRFSDLMDHVAHRINRRKWDASQTMTAKERFWAYRKSNLYEKQDFSREIIDANNYRVKYTCFACGEEVDRIMDKAQYSKTKMRGKFLCGSSCGNRYWHAVRVDNMRSYLQMRHL